MKIKIPMKKKSNSSMPIPINVLCMGDLKRVLFFVHIWLYLGGFEQNATINIHIF